MGNKYFMPYNKTEYCCGCALCYAICPVHAIEMISDLEGFQYPKIDMDVCIDCGKCRSVCVFGIEVEKKTAKQKSKASIFAAKQRDRKILEKSSSGGMFSAISDYFLFKGGAVICSVYDSQTENTKFILAETKEECSKAMGSKYMQSIPDSIYQRAKQWLWDHPDKELLFVGMGCQAAAFRKFAEILGQVKRIYIVDIICHGVPSPLIWREFVNYRFKHQKLEKLNFKDKRKGWLRPTALAVVNGKEKMLDDYIRMFNEGCILRPSCYGCPYARVDRTSDMTIGDYWNIEKKIPHFYDPMGISLVLIHSERGQNLFQDVSCNLEFYESNSDDCRQPNLERPTICPENRSQFWKLYYKKGFKAVYHKYVDLPWIIKCKRFIKHMLLKNGYQS